MALDRAPQLVTVGGVEIAGLPVRLGAAQVLVVHDVLDGVEQLVEGRQGQRRQAVAAEPLDKYGEVLARHARGLALGHPGQRRDDQPDPGQRAALAHEQVRHELVGGPVAAQGGGVRTEHEGKVAEGIAFAAGQQGTAHGASILTPRNGPDGGIPLVRGWAAGIP